MSNISHRPVIVVPTNRKNKFVEFLNSWKDLLPGCHLIVVHDTQDSDLVIEDDGFTHEIFDWADIDNDLGHDAWIIPRRTDCVRSYGFIKALEHRPLFILTLDDDTKPFNNPIQDHYAALFSPVLHRNCYYNTMKTVLPRGYLGELLFPEVSHGVWVGTPDLDAHTQLTSYKDCTKDDFNRGLIPRYAYYSMCGMNLAFKPEVTKHMYFGLQGTDYPVDRCGDIWAGFYVSQLGVMSVTGYAAVFHDRASNPWTNLKKERNAKEMTEKFVDLFCGLQPREELPSSADPYFIKLHKAYNIYKTLCEKRYATP